MYIVLDLETTGLNYNEDEILQVSIIDQDANILINEYCKPKHVKSWLEAQRINKISKEMVENKKPFEEYIDRLNEIFNKAERIIIYNASFEINFLNKYGVSIDNTKIYDLMIEFSEEYGEWSDYYQSRKWVKLTDCCFHYGYSFENAHDSLEDCKATLYCYKKFINNIEDEPIIREHTDEDIIREHTDDKKMFNVLEEKIKKLADKNIELDQKNTKLKSMYFKEKDRADRLEKKLKEITGDIKKEKIIKINDYGFYTAEYCRNTKKPMISREDYPAFADILLSKSRCKKINKPVKDNEKIYAFLRVRNGYCALYYRSNQ